MDEREVVTHVGVTGGPLAVGELFSRVRHDAAGAIVVFTGTVRNHSPGRSGVTHLDYESYQDVVEGKIAQIVEEATSRWSLLAVAVEHRTGRVDVGEPSVVVAVSAPHRGDAFDAARYLIDQLKERAPIWKKEYWEGGAAWSEGA
jgi:molybdopterin synthase catalytic subunit